MLEERSAGPVHDALGNACGTGGKKDKGWMVERQALVDNLAGPVRGDEVLQRDGAGHDASDLTGCTEIGNDYNRCGGRKLVCDGAELVGNGDALARIPIIVAGEEELRRNLAEAVENTTL